MLNYRLLIFDWDGTLADSVGQIVTTMQRAIEALGLPPRDDRQIGELIGLGFADGLQRLYPGMDAQALMQLILEYRRQAPTMAYISPLFEGVPMVLRALADKGYTLAVATGKSREGLDRSLKHHDVLGGLFTTTRCADETADKPNPLMLSEILAELEVSPSEALMIGDTEYDARMAQALGMPALGVTTGVHEPGRLLRAGALSIIEHVRDLPVWLNGPLRSVRVG